MEGPVSVVVTVSPQGRAVDCEVTQSSGHRMLDVTTCRGMERYARFNPALDANGEPTTGTYSTTITWRVN